MTIIWQVLLSILLLAQACQRNDEAVTGAKLELQELEKTYPKFFQGCMSGGENDKKIVDAIANQFSLKTSAASEANICHLVATVLESSKKLHVAIPDIDIDNFCEFPYREIELTESKNIRGLAPCLKLPLLQKVGLPQSRAELYSDKDLRDLLSSLNRRGVTINLSSGPYISQSVFFYLRPVGKDASDAILNIEGDYTNREGALVNVAPVGEQRSDQMWLFVPRNEVFEIRSRSNQMALSASDTTNVVLTKFTGAPNQLWRVTASTEGKGVTIASVKDDRVITLNNNAVELRAIEEDSQNIDSWVLMPLNDDKDESSTVPDFSEDAEWVYHDNTWQKYKFVAGRKYFASGYESSVSELIRDSDNKRFVLKEPHIRKLDRRQFAIDGLKWEYEVRAPLWYKYGLIPRDFEMYMNFPGYGLIKTFVPGDDMNKLQRTTEFFAPGSHKKQKLIELFCKLAKSKVFVGDMHQENLIFSEKADDWIVIDTSDLEENYPGTVQELLEKYKTDEKNGFQKKWLTHHCKARDRHKPACKNIWSRLEKLMDEIVTGCQ